MPEDARPIRGSPELQGHRNQDIMVSALLGLSRPCATYQGAAALSFPQPREP